MAAAAAGRIVPCMNTFFAAVTIGIVVGVAVLAAWVFVIAPFVVPNRRS
jgi:flagellar biosynthesis protein FliR